MDQDLLRPHVPRTRRQETMVIASPGGPDYNPAARRFSENLPDWARPGGVLPQRRVAEAKPAPRVQARAIECFCAASEGSTSLLRGRLAWILRSMKIKHVASCQDGSARNTVLQEPRIR